MYDIVVAYRGLRDTFNFTIEYYGPVASSFEDGPAPFPFKKTVSFEVYHDRHGKSDSFLKQIQGKWMDRTAGGNHTSRNFMNNPQYSLVVTASPAQPNLLADLKLTCETSTNTTVNARIFRGGSRITRFVNFP